MPAMDIDELIKYIDADDGSKKKRKKAKNKKLQQLSKSNKFVETTLDTSDNTKQNSITLNNNNNSKMIDDVCIDKELEDFKAKIYKDSVKFGLYSKLKASFTENWINDLRC